MKQTSWPAAPRRTPPGVKRMRLLAEALDDPALVKLYRGLLACEARHFDTYLDLARREDLVPEAQLLARLEQLAAHEAAVLRETPGDTRLHGATGPLLQSEP